MTNLTLEERAKFESLLSEYAIAVAEVNRAVTRKHDALHAIQDYVNARTKELVQIAQQPAPAEVPTGTNLEHTLRLPLTDEALTRGAKHARGVAPVGNCCCATCCELRTLASIGKSFETVFDPPSSGFQNDTSGGN